jgi:hypothetical protein
VLNRATPRSVWARQNIEMIDFAREHRLTILGRGLQGVYLPGDEFVSLPGAMNDKQEKGW